MAQKAKPEAKLKPTPSLFIITGQRGDGLEQDEEYVSCTETFKVGKSMDKVQQEKQRIFKKQGWVPLEKNPKSKHIPKSDSPNRIMGYYKRGIEYVMFLRDHRDDKLRHFVWVVHIIATNRKYMNMFDYYKEHAPSKK